LFEITSILTNERIFFNSLEWACGNEKQSGDLFMVAYLLVISMICGFIRMPPTMVGGKLGN